MTTEIIKAKINKLFEKGDIIHMNVSLNHPKVLLTGVPVKIKEVYAHLFRIKEVETGKYFTIQYTDILIDRVQVLEFENIG